MGVTDCHVHINPYWEMRPDALALLGPGGREGRAQEYIDHPRKFLAYLDESGIERAVLVNYVAPEVIGYTERSNDFVSRFAATDPKRLVAIGSVLPSHPEPGAEVERLHRELGIRGIKVHPSHQLYAPNGYLDGSAPGLRQIYATAERLKMPVIIHTGTSVFPRARNKFSHPMFCEDLAIDFPKLTVVLAHGGRPLWTEEAFFLARRFPNVFLELSSAPPNRILTYFPRLASLPDKILFGTDWPGPGVPSIAANLAAFRALPLPKDVIERALSTNPDHVFRRN